MKFRITPILAVVWCAVASAQVNLQPDSGRDCAVCHTEWTQAFERPGAVLLMPRPEKPLVAESDSCLGCHDGSVGDSRRMVWLEHSHKTGITPSQSVKVPANLPLDDGKLSCRTCHTAHSKAGTEQMRNVFFLRVNNEQGQLCSSCHQNKMQGPIAGSHPIGPMKKQAPPGLLQAGAYAGPKNDQVVCQSCHMAHGSKQEHLLVLGTEASQLCATCHEDQRPGKFRDPGNLNKPRNLPITKASDLAAIKDMGTHVGAGNTLVCLSCHKVHSGQAGRAMLADTLENGKFCIRCHDDKSALTASGHDMRKVAPNELNMHKETPAQSGQCGSCHGFHNYSRKPTPTNGDPLGLCTTCHSEGQVAAKHSGMPFSHPGKIDPRRVPKDAKLPLFPLPEDPTQRSIACMSCHEPHSVSQKHFLRTQGDALCGSCHAEQVAKLSGPHDFTTKDMVNARGRKASDTGKCSFCHAVHDAKGAKMWIATANAPKDPDQVCGECHRADGLAGKHPIATFNHPTGEKATFKKKPEGLKLPLFANMKEDPDGHVACGSCHDVHGGKESKSLMRAGSPSQLCTQCHVEQAQMAAGSHDLRKGEKKFPVGMEQKDDLCTNCHRPHSSDPDKRRWTVAMQDGFAGDAACAGCHRDHGWTATDKNMPAGALLHPKKADADTTTSKSHGFPMSTSDTSEMACRTCHNPHAGKGQVALLNIKADAPKADLCTTCHTDMQHIEKSMHSRKLMDAAKPGDHACAPCHSVHAHDGSIKDKLWASKLDKSIAMNAQEEKCIGCHNPKGNAQAVEIFRHPATAMKKLQAATNPAAPTAKPFPIDELSCNNCHLPHGRELAADEQSLPQLNTARLSAIKPMLKPNIYRDVCTACHGLDATRVYLYFHNPKKREQVKKYLE